MNAPSPGRTGTLFGVGVGPGDVELMTRRAERVIDQADVIAHFAARGRPGNSWRTIESLVREDHVVERLEYPVTTERVGRDHYERALTEFYERSTSRLAAHLDAGRDVAVVSEGDPLFYGSYMHLHVRLGERYPTEVVPGVTAFSAACAAAGLPLVSSAERLTVLPGILPFDDLKAALAGEQAAVIMKVGRHLDDVRTALDAVDRSDQAVYVERASCPDERIVPLADASVDAPYFSLVLVPGTGLVRRSTPA